MSSYFSIIQYVPNPIADEKINIGVLVFDDENIRVWFTKKWQKVERFGEENIDYLIDFAHSMQKAVDNNLLYPGDTLKDKSRRDRVYHIHENWCNSIQFTEPRGSLKENVNELLKDTINKFIKYAR